MTISGAFGWGILRLEVHISFARFLSRDLEVMDVMDCEGGVLS